MIVGKKVKETKQQLHVFSKQKFDLDLTQVQVLKPESILQEKRGGEYYQLCDKTNIHPKGLWECFSLSRPPVGWR